MGGVGPGDHTKNKHIYSSSQNVKIAYKEKFLTVWIHVDRHAWWASKFLQSQNFLSGSLAWSSTSLHIKHSVSAEKREMEMMNACYWFHNASWARFPFRVNATVSPVNVPSFSAENNVPSLDIVHQNPPANVKKRNKKKKQCAHTAGAPLFTEARVRLIKGTFGFSFLTCKMVRWMKGFCPFIHFRKKTRTV